MKKVTIGKKQGGFNPQTMPSKDEWIPELGEVAVGVGGANEDGLVLAHSSVDEEQRGIVKGNGGGRVPVGVGVIAREEVHEGFADLL